MTSPALRARLTSWIDMMLSPPSSKKLSSMPDPRNPEHLRKQRAQQLLLRRCAAPAASQTASAPAPAARGGPACRSASAADAPAPPAQTAPVVRQPTATAQPAAPRLQHRASRSHHVAHQTRCPAAILPRHHRSLRHPSLQQQRRLDLARLNPEPAKLQLRVRTTQELQNPVRAPARQVPGPVHPAPQPNHTDPQQTAPPSDQQRPR